MTTATRPANEYHVHLRSTRRHPKQAAFVASAAQRIIIRAGRRGGKTTGIAIKAVNRFLAGDRILYAAPTQEQVEAFWWEVKRALAEPVERGIYTKHEGRHLIERPGTKQRIRAKTAWNADTLRGDYADLLILDEWQLMDEEAWEQVGQPMLLDNDGDAVLIYTPPSLRSRSVSKARDPRHAARMFQAAEADTSGRWAAFHFTSRDNPHISATAIDELAQDMSALSFRQEIMAEDVDDVPGALWTRALLDQTRVVSAPALARVVIGVDPPGGGTECGVIAAGIAANGHLYILADSSKQVSPQVWAGASIELYERLRADRIVGEVNYGGDMVASTIHQAATAMRKVIAFAAVHASRGKAVRAEPIVAMFEQGRAHLVGSLPALEDELCMWVPGVTQQSPNRLDAMVWAATDLTQQHVESQMVVYDDPVTISPY